MKIDFKKILVILAAVYIAAVFINTVFTIFTDAPASSFEYTADKDGGIILTAYNGHRFTVNIPDSIDGMPVIGIGESAFYNSSCDYVRFPSGLRTIGAEAFMGSCIRRAELPDGLEFIGTRAFYKCGRLKTVTLPESLEHIDGWAFDDTPFAVSLYPTE